jgi:hypothetical protein
MPRLSPSGSVRKRILSKARINGGSIIACIPTTMRRYVCISAIKGGVEKRAAFPCWFPYLMQVVQYILEESAAWVM